MILSLLTIFASAFVITLSGALMPGPLLTAALSESSQRGFWAGPMLMVGHATLELALLVGLFLGLAPLLTSESVFIVMALVGSVVLGWMALGMFRSLPSMTLELEPATASGGKMKGRGGVMATGAILSIANPYWSVWWATIGLGYVIKSRELGWWGVLAFFLGHQAADFGWYSLVSLAVDRGRRFLSDRLYRGIIAFCAAILVFFAVFFAYHGLARLNLFSVFHSSAPF